MSPRGGLGVLVLVMVLGLPPSAPGGCDDQGHGAWSDVVVPGGSAALAQAAGFETSLERARVVFEIARRLYTPYGEAGRGKKALEDVTAHLASAARGGRADGDTVPLPLAPDVWSRVVFRRTVPQPTLVAAILGDRRAALLYRGLASLDAATLRYLADTPEALAEIHRQHGEVFAAFGRSLHVKEGRVRPTADPESALLWESLVGEPLAKPIPFLRALFGRDEGRLAFFYDTVAHLDEPRRAFALGAALADRDLRQERFARLYAAFARSADSGVVSLRPFARPPVDVALVLERVAVTPAGALRPPASRALWQAVFEAGDPAGEAGPADAAWLAEQVGAAPSAVRSDRLAAFLFAQRVFPRAPEGADLIAALQGLLRYRALALTFERLVLVDPELHAAAARHADRLAAIRDDGRAAVAQAQLQGALALVERARVRHVLDRSAGAALVESLLSTALSHDGRYQGRIARWIEDRLLPALRAATGATPEDPAEAVVAMALAGVAAKAVPAPRLQWEGLPYRVDPAVAALLRFQRVREKQDGASLDDALERCRGARHAPGSHPRVAQGDVLLAEVLTSLVYAAQLGPPDGPALAGASVALRHDFGLAAGGDRARAAWRVPREEGGLGWPWHVSGSLLGLDVGLARLELRRLTGELPDRPPSLNEKDRQGFTLGLALMDPAALDDADRDAIAAAIRRGRERVARLASDPGEAERISGDLRFCEWRSALLPWMLVHEPDSATRSFSLLELFWLGRPEGASAGRYDPWGAPDLLAHGFGLRLPQPDCADPVGQSTGGQMASRIPDLNLRVAEALSEMSLPAALAPGVLRVAVADFVDEVRPAHAADWSALVRHARELPRDRIEDDVSTLAAGGPLIAVFPAKPPAGGQ